MEHIFSKFNNASDLVGGGMRNLAERSGYAGMLDNQQPHENEQSKMPGTVPEIEETEK